MSNFNGYPPDREVLIKYKTRDGFEIPAWTKHGKVRLGYEIVRVLTPPLNFGSSKEPNPEFKVETRRYTISKIINEVKYDEFTYVEV